MAGFVDKLQATFQRLGIPFEVHERRESFTPDEIEGGLHLLARPNARVLLLRVDGKLVQAVVPTDAHLDWKKIRTGLGARQVVLAPAREAKLLLPDADPAALPPLGSELSKDMSLVADSALRDRDEWITVPVEDFWVKIKAREFWEKAKPRAVSMTEAEGRGRRAA